MALWICTACTCRYSVGAPRCPQCDSTQYVEEGAEDMAKITVHGGPSNAAADEQEGGEDVSAGTSSSTSSEEEPSTPEASETAPRKRARGAGSRSKQDPRAESSTAGSTDGSGPATGTADED